MLRMERIANFTLILYKHFTANSRHENSLNYRFKNAITGSSYDFLHLILFSLSWLVRYAQFMLLSDSLNLVKGLLKRWK